MNKYCYCGNAEDSKWGDKMCDSCKIDVGTLTVIVNVLEVADDGTLRSFPYEKS